MVRFEPIDDAGREPAPVVYLPGAAPGMKRRSPLDGRGPVRRDPVGPESDDPDSGDPESGAPVPGDPESLHDVPLDAAAQLAQAEKLLLTRLRRRSLSVAEARAVVEELDGDAAEALIERFCELGYLDDARLADQVVHSHRDRKGLGRSGVEAEMRRRRIPQQAIQRTLEETPDDEEERAVEAACKRAAQLARYDAETIERRLTGFLMRKGYSSAVVRAAVRQALASVLSPGLPTSGVLFR
jgi:regulatory protein